MATDDEIRGELWLLALRDELVTKSCPTCNEYLQKISQHSSIWISDDLKLHGQTTGGYIHLDVGLHSSSRLFADVFNSKTHIQEGHFKGSCSTCGRGFKYYYQPKSAHPGKLSIQRKQARTDFSKSASKPVAKPQPMPEHKLETPARLPRREQRSLGRKPGPFPSPREPLRAPDTEVFRPADIARSTECSSPREEHEKLVLGPPEGGDWAESLEHRWTARWDREVSFWTVWPTPDVVWVETRRPKNEGFLSDVTGLDRHSGDTVFRKSAASLIAANGEIVLIKPKSQAEFAVESRTGKRLWTTDDEVTLKGLTSKAVLAVDRFTNALVIAPLSDNGRELGPWVQPYESDTYKLKSVLSRGDLWTASFEGSSKKTEVRHPDDHRVLWQMEFGFGPEDKTYITPDPWGWLVQQGTTIKSFDREAKLTCQYRGLELLSAGPRFVVGQHPSDPGGIWGAAEPALGAFDRWTGKGLSLSRKHFESRRCFCVSGDVLWCVCESEKVLRGYDLAGRKVVKEITPLPIQSSPSHLPAKIQFFAKYGCDLYLTSKKGHLVAFTSDGE